MAYEKGDLVWLCTPMVGKKKCKKLYCPWSGPYKVVKKLSDQVYRIQHTQNRKRQVVHFERLKSCSPDMRPRSQTNTSNNSQDSVQTNQDAALEESIPVPPGTVLHLVDQDDDMQELNNVPTLNNQVDNPVQQSTNHTRHRYPQRENRRRPLRYQDD